MCVSLDRWQKLGYNVICIILYAVLPQTCIGGICK